MPQNIIETPGRGETIVAPSSGDPVTDSSIVQGEQPIGNRLAYLEANAVGASPRTNTPVSNGLMGTDQGANWSFNGFPLWTQTDASTAGNLAIPLSLPPGVTLTSLRLHCVGDGAATHAGLPGTMPSIQLYEQKIDGTVATLLGSASDSSVNVAAYETEHTIDIAPAAVVKDDYYYVLLVQGETGANALDNALQVYGVDASWSAP